jgi:RNA recognition motif-containing protein
MAKGIFKIYVGNLDYKVTEFAVRRLFEPFGEIEDIAMAQDKETSKPRGFAIVMMRDHEQGQSAIDGVRGRQLMGRELVVNEAIRKKKSEKRKPGEPLPKRENAPSNRERAAAASSGSRVSSGRNVRRSVSGRNPRRSSRPQ